MVVFSLAGTEMAVNRFRSGLCKGELVVFSEPDTPMTFKNSANVDEAFSSRVLLAWARSPLSKLGLQLQSIPVLQLMA